MAYHQNGQAYRGQRNSPHSSPNLSNQYEGYMPLQNNQPRPPRRTASHDIGGASRLTEDGAGTQGETTIAEAMYRTGSIANTQHQELFMGVSSPPMTNTANASYSSGAYQHHSSSSTSNSATPAPYNPQQYGQTQSQYNPQAYSNVSSSYSASYQPYIPAAYQATNAPPTSNYGSPQYDNSTSHYGNPSVPQTPIQPPPVPPRGPEPQYGNRRLSHGAPPSMASQQDYQALANSQYRNAPLPPLPGHTSVASRPFAYTPPAPPPPPFSPVRDAFPLNITSTGPIRPYIHSNSVSQTSIPQLSGSRQSNSYVLPMLPSFSSSASSTPPGNQHSVSPWQSPDESLPSTPGPPPPQHSPQRMNTVDRHPHARPLPGPPPTSVPNDDYFDSRNGGDYEDIMKEVEAAVMGRAPSSGARQNSPRAERINYRSPINEEEEPQPLFSGNSHTVVTPDSNYPHTNGATTTGTGDYGNIATYSDESDAEAAAGLAAMQMAEEQEAADQARRYSGSTLLSRNQGSQGSARLPDPPSEHSSDSDVPVDMETYGGGFPSHYQYGNEPVPYSASQAGRSDEVLDFSDNSYLLPDQDEIHPFPTFGARVDTGGTGGLSEPSSHPRRLSFEDGDEATLVDFERGQVSGSQSPNESISDMSSLPSRGPSRPLPRVPPLSTADTYRPRRQTDQFGRPIYPLAPDEYEQSHTPAGTPVQKANSIGSHSSTPLVVPPGRSITDAEQRRRMQQLSGLRTTVSYDSASGPDTSLLSGGKLTDIDLPEIPNGKRKKYNPAKLSSADFSKCTEPWALSSILAWVKDMTEGEADLKQNAIVDGIVALFTHKVPTMNTADAETLSARLVMAMFTAGALIKEEEWVKFGAEPISGVLYQLTGTGCYSPRLHSSTVPGRCYSHHCMRTLKKVNLQTQLLEPQRKVEDWATFYKMKKEDIESIDKKEVERQNILHEIVTTEDAFMDQLNVLRILYRDGLAKSPQPILQPRQMSKFLQDVFGKVDPIKQVNEDFLLPQLKYRQQEQGPWIVGFSDIFREWIRKAKNAYIGYAEGFPRATFLVRKEADQNVLFRQFLDQMRENERSKRLGWDTYLKAPITRLQRYTLLLSTVHKNMRQDTEERAQLQKAIEEVKIITLECDARVAEHSRKVDLEDLDRKLSLRPGMDKVQLNLLHMGREIVFQGDLQRTGNKSFTWLDTRAILFDHFLVLAKVSRQRDHASGGLKKEVYDVSKLPIPMDLLVLESANDDPVVKSAVKGIGAVTTVTTRVHTPQDIRPGGLMHSTTNTSIASIGTTGSGKSLTTVTVLDSPRDENVMYPFRIKHLGKTEAYTLYAPSAQNRQDWCEKIVLAKTRHAASLFAQNAEPFRLRVMADAAFAYDTMSGWSKNVVIKGTPLDRAIREVEKSFDNGAPKSGPVCRATVNCATAFNQPYGRAMVAVGTDYGVFISEYDKPRGWTRAIAATRVTQVAVLEEFSLFLLIADKSLVAYHLDTVCPVAGTANISSDASSRRAPQKLSGSRDVGFFSSGRMKDRTLVFYKKREGISSTFKVLEPVFQKSSTASRTRFGIRRGTTEFFRDFAEFYIPTETYAINLFQSSMAIATARGFEILTLDKFQTHSIPDLKHPDCASIAARVRDQKPLGMFRLSDSEFLLVFEEVGIYVDKHGDVSRSVVMEFVGRAKQAVLYGGLYLVLMDNGAGFVEVRNAENGRLRQVISGRDVKLLDDGGSGGTIKICMQHPEVERSQVVVEMIVNEGLKE